MLTKTENNPKRESDGPKATIWKYAIEQKNVTVHEIPRGAKALHVGGDPDGKVCIWFVVDPTQPMEKRGIILVGTGQPVPMDAAKAYVGTFVIGPYVHHVFAPVEVD